MCRMTGNHILNKILQRDWMISIFIWRAQYYLFYPLLIPSCCFRQSFLLTMTHILTHIPGMSGCCRKMKSLSHCMVIDKKSNSNILTYLLFSFLINQILIHGHKSNNALQTVFTSRLRDLRLAASPRCPHSEAELPLLSPASLSGGQTRSLARPPQSPLTGPDQLKAAPRSRILADRSSFRILMNKTNTIWCNGMHIFGSA